LLRFSFGTAQLIWKQAEMVAGRQQKLLGPRRLTAGEEPSVDMSENPCPDTSSQAASTPNPPEQTSIHSIPAGQQPPPDEADEAGQFDDEKHYFKRENEHRVAKRAPSDWHQHHKIEHRGQKYLEVMQLHSLGHEQSQAHDEDLGRKFRSLQVQRYYNEQEVDILCWLWQRGNEDIEWCSSRLAELNNKLYGTGRQDTSQGTRESANGPGQHGD
jgi:hypothetical protein